MVFSVLVVGRISEPLPHYPNAVRLRYAVLRYVLENRVGKKWRWYEAGRVSELFVSYGAAPSHVQKLPRARPIGRPKWHQLRGFISGVAALNETVREIFSNLDADWEVRRGPVTPTEAGVLADALQDAGVPEGHPVLGALRSWEI